MTWEMKKSRISRSTYDARRKCFTEKRDTAKKLIEKILAHTILFKRNTYYYNNNIIIYNII